MPVSLTFVAQHVYFRRLHEGGWQTLEPLGRRLQGRGIDILSLFGTGATRLQPVYVGDVADAVAQALVRPEAVGRTYALGGPRTYRYQEILKLILRQTGRRRLLLPLPFWVWETLAALPLPLPKPPVSRDQVTLMKADNVVATDLGTLRDLGIVPTPLEAILPSYLKRH